MKQLELIRERAERARMTRMSKGLSDFVDAKEFRLTPFEERNLGSENKSRPAHRTGSRDSKSDMTSSTGLQRGPSSLLSRTRDAQEQDNRIYITDQASLPGVTSDTSSVGDSNPSVPSLSQKAGDTDNQLELHSTFARASFFLKEAFDIEGW
jgi:hypothetical protein